MSWGNKFSCHSLLSSAFHASMPASHHAQRLRSSINFEAELNFPCCPALSWHEMMIAVAARFDIARDSGTPQAIIHFPELIARCRPVSSLAHLDRRWASIGAQHRAAGAS